MHPIHLFCHEEHYISKNKYQMNGIICSKNGKEGGGVVGGHLLGHECLYPVK